MKKWKAPQMKKLDIRETEFKFKGNKGNRCGRTQSRWSFR